MSTLKPSTEGVSIVIPMLVCRDAVAEIDFCKATFGAGGGCPPTGPDGSLIHALLTIGGAMIMLHADFSSLSSRAPQPDGSSPVVICVYAKDADTVIERAMVAGARGLIPVQNQFWGDCVGRIVDPAGHVWNISTRVEETFSVHGEQRGRKRLTIAFQHPAALLLHPVRGKVNMVIRQRKTAMSNNLDVQEAPADVLPILPNCKHELKFIWVKTMGIGFIERKQFLLCPHCRSFLGIGNINYT